ncbi:DUF1612 and helix-turn-helix domain-containing protein [Rhizobium lemnae]|uniref:RHE_PE00001 family protein n=1 Tax=Rhizobium lemnae TaxID=1214924 RepID=A0ABV8EBN2_9HYPH|nr:RHE_PE00001 family protein [Rhizobium lemnae]MCJ8507390.1 DUF1612 and helix-turn-helix domain-containing protein [Rhizobium lemnae]
MTSTACISYKLNVDALLNALISADSALVRLDERLSRSPIQEGFLERFHFTDACASMWIDGELVHLEDLVLHDVAQDSRAPSHELTIANNVLRQRRRIVANKADWALTTSGIASLRGKSIAEETPRLQLKSVIVDDDREPDDLDSSIAAMDALLTKSEAVLHDIRFTKAPSKESLVYDEDWDEEERLSEWLQVVSRNAHYPALLQCVIALDSWNMLQVFQHGSWLGRLLAASLLRQRQRVTGSHLPALNLSLKLASREDRSARDPTVRLRNILDGIRAMAEFGLKEHDRLFLAHQMMSRHLVGRRSSSRLPQLINLVLSKPIVSTEMVARQLRITQRAALRLIEELNLREVTGRGRFRAWGIF